MFVRAYFIVLGCMVWLYESDMYTYMLHKVLCIMEIIYDK